MVALSQELLMPSGLIILDNTVLTNFALDSLL